MTFLNKHLTPIMNRRDITVLTIAFLLLQTMNIQGVTSGTSRLQVHIPSSLNTGTKDGYDHRDALFGIPPYGGSIQEIVYYTTDTLCSSKPADGSVKTKYKSYPDTNGKPFSSPFILMVDRGECTFVQKVRNAQKGGAAAVLIADNACQCSAADCKLEKGETCEYQEPIMADDGSGADISIPSFLVFKQDADKMKDVLLQNKPIRVEMSFSIPSPDSLVSYDLWTTPSDPMTRTFIQSFKSAALALKGRARFTPRDYIYDGTNNGCQDRKGNNQCFSLCTNSGRYCATDPDDDMEGGISGADVVKESLRRTCIWKVYGSDDGVGIEWWDYVTEFMYRCDDPDKPGFFTSEQCVKDSMEHAGVNYDKIVTCINDSGGLENNTKNTLFDEQLNDKETTGAFLIPSMFINHAPIRGELVYSTVFRAICAGYAHGYEPTICTQCATCNDEAGCVNADGKCSTGVSQYAMTNTVSTSFFGSTLGILTLVFLCLGYCQYRRQQYQMNDQIRGIVQEYMPVGANMNKDNSLGIGEDDDEGFT